MHYLSASLLTLLFLSSCRATAQPAMPPEFGSRVDRGLVALDAINEASGLAASTRESNLLWTHNDSGDSTRIFAMGVDGSDRGTWHIEGIAARDWEDIASGPGPVDSLGYLYIGEIGDNNARYETKVIYRIVEPRVGAASGRHSIDEVDAISFRYPDGPRDAEGLFVDPVTLDIYVVSKRETSVRLYRLPWPQSLDTTITAEHLVTFEGMTQITAAAISPDGSEILMKNYTNVFYWYRGPGQSVAEACSEEPTDVPYLLEAQGEAITFDSDGQGYYTVPEEPGGVPARLSYYPRLMSGATESDERRMPKRADLQVAE